MILLFLSIVLAPAQGAEIDKAPSGTVITVRPQGDERAVILTGASCDEAGLGDAPVPMWLVNPAAWRKAVASGVRLAELSELPDEQSKVILGLEEEIAGERVMRSQTRLELEAALERNASLQKSQPMLIAGGLLTGALTTGILVLAL